MEKYSIYIMDAKRGERIWSTTTYEHMFIYMGNNTGIMLTSTDYNGINHKADPSWFDKNFRYRHTHYVPAYLIKEVPVELFKYIAALSEVGKNFFDNLITDKETIHWNDYIKIKQPHRAVLSK